MALHAYDPKDIQALSELLEMERKHYTTRRSICFSLFVFWLLMLVVAVLCIAWVTVGAHQDLLSGPLVWIQGITAMSAAVVSFFSLWWSTQNCIHSIDRTLFAARAGRDQLFQSFLQEIQCAGKEKKRLWLDLVKDLLG